MVTENLLNSWQKMSLIEQLGNIGSEVGRAAKWENKDESRFYIAVEKGLDLLEATIKDSRWGSKNREIILAKELFADAVLGGKEYKTSLADMEKYFMQFAMLAMK
ncbi:MAG: hypothetical protein WD896_01410 [Parcubacteria group bacterium]